METLGLGQGAGGGGAVSEIRQHVNDSGREWTDREQSSAAPCLRDMLGSRGEGKVQSGGRLWTVKAARTQVGLGRKKDLLSEAKGINKWGRGSGHRRWVEATSLGGTTVGQ